MKLRAKTNRHEDAGHTDVWTQPFPYPCALPEDTHDSIRTVRCQSHCHYAVQSVPILVSVHDSRRKVVDVGAGADEEEEHQEERLEVEERRLIAVSAYTQAGMQQILTIASDPRLFL